MLARSRDELQRWFTATLTRTMTLETWRRRSVTRTRADRRRRCVSPVCVCTLRLRLLTSLFYYPQSCYVSTPRFHTRQRLRWKLTWATNLTAWVSLLHMKDVSSTSVLLGNRQELALFYANDFSFSSVIKTTHGVIYSSFCIDSHYDETDIVFLTSGRWEMRNSVDSNDSALVSSSL